MNAKTVLEMMERGIYPADNSEFWKTCRDALRLLAAAEGGEGTPETDTELATHKVIMENGGYCGTEPWSGLVTGRFARSLETQRNALAARVAELERVESYAVHLTCEVVRAISDDSLCGREIDEILSNALAEQPAGFPAARSAP